MELILKPHETKNLEIIVFVMCLFFFVTVILIRLLEHNFFEII